MYGKPESVSLLQEKRKKLQEVKPPSTDRDRLNDTIERRKKNVYGMK
ncbi:MAG: hypothetical protein MPEBLZ_04037 [Candidatus Methanoperedens nitroreducens]|uniref:Uncharacterized protein n=1 Tax=Candidatus Methanoperedens nitratireducens TaxID=1392998 RepID=A0A0P8ABL7_9EURY|nr:MAG: hypothetical protein MPEBLZ_04037 [Candidatus Methanoperedens sp. BLZ1]